ncbi:MAG: glycyl-radical enzyme activating protein [Bacteroidaceae bacterium]|jgi:pyruvate formate lyase activating enzyme
MSKTLLFDIKRYSINDGPGIRITLFMKGCPLHCIWCHNPEGISSSVQRLYTKKKCIGCQTCVEACPHQALKLTRDGIVCDKTRCVVCGKCAEVCPSLAIEMSGKEYTYDELMKEIEKETEVMDQSQGGVTFCGGEPLLHPDFLLEMLRRCGQLDIHRAVDTTLYAAPRVVEAVAQECELFLVDLKQMDRTKHYSYTGVYNDRILSNIRMIAEMGKSFWIRIPLIHGVNADAENLSRTADFLASLPWQEKKVDLLPYHDIGRMKHEKLGTVYNPKMKLMTEPSDEEKDQAVQIFTERGLNVGFGG